HHRQYHEILHDGWNKRVCPASDYCTIVLNQEGYKELLGLNIGHSEGSKSWLQVLTDLQNLQLEPDTGAINDYL
ncbi:MAG TPA: transposase, partial [Puia sp.]|nr:transposase [Puia sp.]